MLIPRIFHRFWDRPPIPERFERFAAGWLTMNPAWSLMTWNGHWGGMLPADLLDVYNRQTSGAGRADIMRFALLARYGGVWIDTDFECLRPIEGLVSELECFAASEDQSGFDAGSGRLFPLVSTAIMGSVPGHPAFTTAARLLGTEWRPSDDLPLASGPKFFTRMLIEHNLRASIRVFPPALFYPWAYGEPAPEGDLRERFPAAYAVHHWAASWKERSPCE